MIEKLKNHSLEDNQRALDNVRTALKRQEDVINNFDNYKRLGYIQDENDPRRKGHQESYDALLKQEKVIRDYLENETPSNYASNQTSKKQVNTWAEKEIPPMETKYHPDGYLSIKLN